MLLIYLLWIFFIKHLHLKLTPAAILFSSEFVSINNMDPQYLRF